MPRQSLLVSHLLRQLTPRNRRVVFHLLLATFLLLALFPPPELPLHTGGDKLQHALAFAVLALLSGLAHPELTARVRCAALCGYGLLMEGLQSLTPYRSAEWGDLGADLGGILVGLALGWFLGLADYPKPHSGSEEQR